MVNTQSDIDLAVSISCDDWPVLHHHIIDGRCIAPTMLIMEWFAEAATQQGILSSELREYRFNDIRNYRLAAVHATSTETFHFEYHDGRWRVWTDIRNQQGKVIRHKVCIMDFIVELCECFPVESDTHAFTALTDPSGIRYDIGSQVWEMGSHPYGSMLMTRTGTFMEMPDVSGFWGHSILRAHRQQFCSDPEKRILTPVDVSIAAMQQLSFWGEWNHNPGIPGNIGSLHFVNPSARPDQLLVHIRHSDIAHDLYQVNAYDKDSGSLVVAIHDYQLMR